jgi:DNA-binding NarL/FixJ family response regulator
VIRVLLADDDLLVRSGLRALLDAEEDLTVVGEAADGRQAVDRARELRPDVVLMDVRMPRLDGVSATREIVSWPQRPSVLVLTTFDLDDVVDDALDAGADGFLLKRATPEQLIDGIRTVHSGDALVAPAVTRRLLAAYSDRRPRERERLQQATRLTEREADILRALAEGLSNTEIAGRMWLSPETVKTHVKSILVKLGVRDRTQAVVWAYRTGFVGLSSGGGRASVPGPQPGPSGEALA